MNSNLGLSDRILAWFDENRRDLPWRRTGDPYHVWISEVMLQQTQVDRVVPFFERFIERFPDVQRLAGASVDQVLAAWSGLGYYRRARLLHAAARQIVTRGDFPCEIGDWEALPGVGPYTAAAVTSIAFGVRTPVLDGNVERVLSRFIALEEDPKRAGGRRRLLETASTLLDEERPGDSNQALMEIGATICRPSDPACAACPLSVSCLGWGKRDPERYPVRSRSRKRIVERRLAVVVEREHRLLLFRRSDHEQVLAGLWEVPWTLASEPDAEKGLATRYGGRWQLEQKCGQVRHSITYRDIRVAVWRGRISASEEIGEGLEAGWFARGELDRIAVPTLVAKIVRQGS